MLHQLNGVFGEGLRWQIPRAKSAVLVQFSPVAQSCWTLCDPMDCSMPGLRVHHQIPEFAQTYVH